MSENLDDYIFYLNFYKENDPPYYKYLLQMEKKYGRQYVASLLSTMGLIHKLNK